MLAPTIGKHVVYSYGIWYHKRKGRVIMIHLFNRKKLLLTTSMERQAHVREILAANNIPYQARTSSNISRSRGVIPGMRMDMLYQYHIYVKRSDYEKAKYLIR